MVDRFEHFTFATNEITKFWRKLAVEEMEKHGLHAPHAIYFTVLARNNHTGLTATQLCEYSGRDKADVSRMLSLMEKKGLAVRQYDGQSRYNGVFKLTQEGLDIAGNVMTKASQAVAIAGRDLSEETRRVFYSALDSIVANLKELCEKGIPQL